MNELIYYYMKKVEGTVRTDGLSKTYDGLVSLMKESPEWIDEKDELDTSPTQIVVEHDKSASFSRLRILEPKKSSYLWR